jgi:hypothetical protein
VGPGRKWRRDVDGGLMITDEERNGWISLGQALRDYLSFSRESQTGAPAITESLYELPSHQEAVEAIMKHKKESVQDTLSKLAEHGWYLVKRKS